MSVCQELCCPECIHFTFSFLILLTIFSNKAQSYPSSFLQNRGQKPTQCVKGKGKLVTYERDIICLPKSFGCQGNLIDIPRKKDIRRMLAVNKLVGKIQLHSGMEQEEIYQEIRFVFSTPMGGADQFLFKILQSSGSDSCNLMVPELSTSYRWTAATAAGKNSKAPIYILAEDSLLVCDLLLYCMVIKLYFQLFYYSVIFQ